MEVIEADIQQEEFYREHMVFEISQYYEGEVRVYADNYSHVKSGDSLLNTYFYSYSILLLVTFDLRE